MLQNFSSSSIDFGNKIIGKHAGGEQRPIFFDIESTCKELLLIDQQFDTVKSEFNFVNQHYDLQAYHELDRMQYGISGKVAPQQKWKVFVLDLMGETPELAAKLCPETCAVLKKIPNLFQAFFSVLEPRKPIPAHTGPYSGYIRYHLGVKVPSQAPPTIRLKDQYYTWQTGKSVLFDDTWEHEVFNESNEERVVLIVDIFRPLPFLLHQTNSLIIKNLIKNMYGKKVIKNATAEKLNAPK